MLIHSVLTTLILLLTTTTSIDKATERAHERAFERIKKLEGTWKGRSTRGWSEQMTYRVIANGSIVMETSFEAHPNETMVTMFGLDRGRLMLTHYCVAKNQPRLVAGDISEDGKKITFNFLDGTGLSSRDQGHMDKAVFHFTDDDHYTAQWTWYQNGSERWMEKIECERAE